MLINRNELIGSDLSADHSRLLLSLHGALFIILLVYDHLLSIRCCCLLQRLNYARGEGIGETWLLLQLKRIARSRRLCSRPAIVLRFAGGALSVSSSRCRVVLTVEYELER